jgi:hypothetical protein
VSKRPEGSTAAQENMVGLDARASELKVGENGIAHILRQREQSFFLALPVHPDCGLRPGNVRYAKARNISSSKSEPRKK